MDALIIILGLFGLLVMVNPNKGNKIVFNLLQSLMLIIRYNIKNLKDLFFL